MQNEMLLEEYWDKTKNWKKMEIVLEWTGLRIGNVPVAVGSIEMKNCCQFAGDRQNILEFYLL